MYNQKLYWGCLSLCFTWFTSDFSLYSDTVCIGKVLGHCVDNIKVANDGLDYLDSCKVMIQYKNIGDISNIWTINILKFIISD